MPFCLLSRAESTLFAPCHMLKVPFSNPSWSTELFILPIRTNRHSRLVMISVGYQLVVKKNIYIKKENSQINGQIKHNCG